jgi:hypothetical protein
MTDEVKRALKKRLVELVIAALTALITALATGCAVRWSSNAVEVQPHGFWSYQSKSPSVVTNQ